MRHLKIVPKLVDPNKAVLLKSGYRFGSFKKHAVVVKGHDIYLAVLNADNRWTYILKAHRCAATEKHLMKQIFEVSPKVFKPNAEE